MIPKGGTFNVKCLTHAITNTSQQFPAMTLETLTLVNLNAPQEAHYYRPIDKNYAGVDALAKANTFLCGFQMTVSTSHKVSEMFLDSTLLPLYKVANDSKKMLNCQALSKANNILLHFYWVVPSTAFPQWKDPKPLDSTTQYKQELWERTVCQWVLELDLSK